MVPLSQGLERHPFFPEIEYRIILPKLSPRE